jgi:hypothetical protein
MAAVPMPPQRPAVASDRQATLAAAQTAPPAPHVPLPRPKPQAPQVASATPVQQPAQTSQPKEAGYQRVAPNIYVRDLAREHKHVPYAGNEVWTDEHGRPLSAHEVREIKRLLHESDRRGTRRDRAESSFDRVWR